MRDTATTGKRALHLRHRRVRSALQYARALRSRARESASQGSGLRDGFATELDCSAQQPADSLCQAIAGMLSRVGIRVSYRPLPFNALLPKLISGDTSMYVIGWQPATLEPEGVLVPLVHTRTGPGVGEYNFGGYSNQQVDAAVDKGRLEFDPAKRIALFTEAMLAIDADAGFVPDHLPQDHLGDAQAVEGGDPAERHPRLRMVNID
jgi:peptide/nickel transport system substrate-binding protein